MNWGLHDPLTSKGNPHNTFNMALANTFTSERCTWMTQRIAVQIVVQFKVLKFQTWCGSSRLVYHCYGNSCVIWNHTVLPATWQRQRSRHNPSRSWYSIYRPRRDWRLSWREPVGVSCSRILRDKQEAMGQERELVWFRPSDHEPSTLPLRYRATTITLGCRTLIIRGVCFWNSLSCSFTFWNL